jgi:hypothetical protein
MKNKKSALSSPPPALHSVAHDLIAERAQAIWRERGSPEGRDMEHWLEAERQLYARRPARRSGVRDPLESTSSEFSPDPENALKSRADEELDTMDEPPDQRSATSL